MRWPRFLTILFLILSFWAFNTATTSADTSHRPEFSEDTLLVKFQAGVNRKNQDEIHNRYGGNVIKEISDIGVQIVKVPPGQALNKAAEYRSDKSVKYAEPDGLVQLADSPDDPYFDSGSQWDITKVQAGEAWDITHGDPAIQVAVLDTGIDTTHPDLAGKVVSSVNFSSSPTSLDLYGHGTHVAGTIAAATNNGLGVAGLGYDSTLVNVKVMADNGTGDYAALIQGITWAADHGAKVINMSLGGFSASSALKDAINYAWNKGLVIVAAAGNSGTDTPFYPAYYTNAIAVAATDSSDYKASFSNYGDWVDIAAPGVNIVSTVPADNVPLGSASGYRYLSGTSMASPHVAGLAALVFNRVVDSNGNGLLNDEVRNTIEQTADKIPVSGIGHGRINAYDAVMGAKQVLPSGVIAGYVRDSATGTPIVGAKVSDVFGSVLSDSQGAYMFSNLYPGVYTLNVSATGYIDGSQIVWVYQDHTTPYNFSMIRTNTGTLSGSVTDASSGESLAGASVTAGTFITTSDSSGNYSLKGIEEGTYILAVSAAGYFNFSTSVSVTSGDTTTVNASLSKIPVNGNITGKVSDSSGGNAIIGATVSDGTRTSLTDATGSFTLSNIPEGTCNVTAAATGYQSITATFSVVAGVTDKLDFSLTKTVTTGTITGKVTDKSSGFPIAQATVSDGTRTSLTGEDGSYILNDVPSGTYNVTASATGYEGISIITLVTAGSTTSVNFALSKLYSPPKMWIDTIQFTVKNKNLMIKVHLASASGLVPGVNVGVQLDIDGRLRELSGITDSTGTATMNVHGFKGSSCNAYVISLDASGYTWDLTKGISSATYTR